MRIEKPDSIVSIHADKPLEVAVETATFNLMDWLISEHGFTPTDAYSLFITERLNACGIAVRTKTVVGDSHEPGEMITYNGKVDEKESEILALVALHLGLSMENMRMYLTTYLIRNRWNVEVVESDFSGN